MKWAERKVLSHAERKRNRYVKFLLIPMLCVIWLVGWVLINL